MKQEKNKRKENGITLIALVITIIVMLILVGVTINLVTSGNLFNYARDAKGRTAEEIEKEQMLANVDLSQYVNGTTGGSTLQEYKEALLTDNGFLANNAKYTDSNRTYPAIIPAGFKVLTSEGTSIDGGLVIQDKNGNEFVWIPVDDINKMIMCQECGPDVALNPETLECPNCKENTKLAGKLYWNSDEWKFSTTNVLAYTDDGLREPAALANYSENPNELTQAQYQAKFDSMAQSVAKNHGFYIGRYEISENYTVKRGQTAKVSITWYDFYTNQETLATGTGAQSEMIWGCQWDQVMLFVNGKPDGQNPSVAFDVTMTGNRYTSDKSTKTGENAKDKVANIFDLEASRYDWTQEADSTYHRVYRRRPL